MTFFIPSDSSDSSESQEPVTSTTRLQGTKKECNSQMTPSTNERLSWMKSKYSEMCSTYIDNETQLTLKITLL